MITLQVNGRKMTFSEEELTSIVEKHFSSEATQQAKTEEIEEKPTEGKWFKVNPLAIDQNLFKEKRKDSRQEDTRQLILEAFEEIKKNPKYTRPFKTMMPEKTWGVMNAEGLKKLASKFGDHNADWVEQSLEWAQRIANGETWEAVCNEKDTSSWYRLVVWDDGFYRRVGGSQKNNSKYHASYVFPYFDCTSNDITVPLVVSY